MEDAIELTRPPTYSVYELLQIIECMRSEIKSTLPLLPSQCFDDFQAIIKQLDNFIIKHCKHTFVCELINISPENSKTIYYCTKCQHTTTTNI